MVGPPPESWEIDPGRARAFELRPGIWQLRLPLPWADVPHVNAYLLHEPDGLVLVDCGSAGHPSHQAALRAALTAAGAELSDVGVLVGTHAHSDHIGLAEWVIEGSGCRFAMHPDTAHFYDATRQPERIAAARRRRARLEGVPEARLADYDDVREETQGVLAPVQPDLALRDGEIIGRWRVLETPGHAPSHICLLDADRRIVILGDLLAPVFAPWFDYGYSADPVAEYLASLDRIEGASPFRLALPGHGRALADVDEAIAVHRAGVADRLALIRDALSASAAGAYTLMERVFGEASPVAGVWRTGEVMAYLRHLRLQGAVQRHLQDGRYLYATT